MTQTKAVAVELQKTETVQPTVEPGIDWDEVKENSRKGLNYIGIGTSFVGEQLTKLGEYLKSV